MKADRVLAQGWWRATLCVLLAWGGAAGAEPARLQVAPESAAPWRSAVDGDRPALRATPAAAPQLDGVLDDACWRDAPATGSFVHLAGVPGAAARWVAMQAAYDQQCLYLAGRLAKPGPTLRATITEQGGRIWADDALEIYLYDRQAGIRYQIDINALGAWWAGADQPWQPALRAAAKMDDQGWTVELALPWRDLRLATPGEHPLRLQFRYLVNGQSAAVSWADAEPEQTAAYGDLTLATAGPDAPNQLQVLRFFQHDALPLGPSAEAAGIELFNPTDTARSANVRLYRVNLVGNRPLRPGPDTAMDAQLTVEVAPGAHQLVRIPGVMPAIESGVIRQTLVVRAVNPATGKPDERLFQNTRDVGALPPFELRLQRERFHFGDQRVEGTLHLGVPEELFAAAALNVQFGTRHQVLQQVNHDHIPGRRLTLKFDLAGLEPDAYQVVARLRHGDQVLEQMLPLVIERALPLPPRQRIALRVNLPAGFAATGPVPLYAGVSFPAGTLLDLAQVRVINGEGEEVPAQVEALAHWGPGGSIRWAGVHFLAPPGADPAGPFFVEFGSAVKRAAMPQPAIRIERHAQALRIDTGAARFDVPRTGPLLGDAWVGDRQALRGGAACLLIADQQGNVATELAGPAEETPQVEVEGPLQVVIRRAGFLRRPDGSTLGKYIVRMTFAAGLPFVRVQHSFVNTEDTMQVQYRDLSLRVQPAFAGPWQVRLDDSPHADGQAFAVQIDPTRAEAASLAQTAFHHHLQKESRFSVAVCRDGEWTEAKTGDACGQWASVSDERGQVGVAVTLRHFVETFPSELSVGPEGLTAHLWTSRGGRLLDYRPATLVDYFGRSGLRMAAGVRARSGKAAPPAWRTCASVPPAQRARMTCAFTFSPAARRRMPCRAWRNSPMTRRWRCRTPPGCARPARWGRCPRAIPSNSRAPKNSSRASSATTWWDRRITSATTASWTTAQDPMHSPSAAMTTANRAIPCSSGPFTSTTNSAPPPGACTPAAATGCISTTATPKTAAWRISAGCIIPPAACAKAR